MKKTTKRLALSKVTIAPLSAEELARAGGGQGGSGISCGDVCGAISHAISCWGACVSQGICPSFVC